MSLLFGIQARPRRLKPFSPDKKQGTWRNFCTQEGLAGPCSVSPSPQHHTHTHSRGLCTHRCTHKYTFIYMCTCTHKHICRHTCRHTQIHAHAYVLTLSPGAGAPPDSLEDPPLYYLGWTSAAFLLQDLLLVGATCLCTPCVCVCVCVCVCARTHAPQENEQVPQTAEEGGSSVCRGFTSSPQAGSRHTVEGGQERLERLQKPATRATQGLG